MLTMMDESQSRVSVGTLQFLRTLIRHIDHRNIKNRKQTESWDVCWEAILGVIPCIFLTNVLYFKVTQVLMVPIWISVVMVIQTP